MPWVIGSLLLLLLLLVLACAQPHGQPFLKFNHIGENGTVPDDVLANQPNLQIDKSELERNGDTLRIGYCVNHSDLESFYTYVYIWSFSDTPLWGELLGYPDHSWDFEPIIVRVRRAPPSHEYIFDKGHYRAGLSSSPNFVVKNKTHQFEVRDDDREMAFPSTQFLELSPPQVAHMNELLDDFPALPFGRGLSLEWACRNPIQVLREGSFSSDSAVARVPTRLQLLAGLLLGLLVGIFVKFLLRLYKKVDFSWVAVIALCSASGLVGGLVGAMINTEIEALVASESIPLIAGIPAGAFAGGIAGAVSAFASFDLRWRSGTILGAIVGAVAASFTGVL